VLSTPNAYSAAYLRLDPTWAALRDDPEFVEMLERHERG